MIRINLLASKDARRRGPGQNTLVIIVLLLVVEVLGMFTWYQSVDETATEQQSALQRVESSVVRLEKAKAKLEEKEKDSGKLARQNQEFDRLKNAKIGPGQMLKFLSYVLTRKEDNLYNREELTAQEAAGWASGWEPDNVWLSQLAQTGDQVMIRGFARSHEDVAEFYRRMESGMHFLSIDPVMQEVVQDVDFNALEVVAFEVLAMKNYNLEGKLKMPRADVPDSLRAMIVEKILPPSSEDKKKGKKKAKGGGH